LRHEPLTETRNRKRLGENPLSDWELRIHQFRVFYDVVDEDDRRVVKIKAVGHKDHNTLIIGGKEGQL
jgi:mRNA-degrading endonuclease RelE of RelBE toxin-antitoxin system